VDRVVLDSSAFLAHLNEEVGGAAVGALFSRSMICAVNACEVAAKIVIAGRSVEDAKFILLSTGVEIVDFDVDLALAAGGMIAETKSHGLSLGDRACLALAARENLPALTADRAWKGVDVGVEIQFIR